jgi:hypothetical protein
MLVQVNIAARLWLHPINVIFYDAASMPWSNDDNAVKNAVRGENGAMKSNANNPFVTCENQA